MERNRCAHCRNPIRHGGDVSAPSAGLQQAWFHPDCWADVVSAKQKDYLREVEKRGLEALLAPYISAAPAGSKVVELADGPIVEQLAARVAGRVVPQVSAQAKSTDIRATRPAAPLRRPKSA